MASPIDNAGVNEAPLPVFAIRWLLRPYMTVAPHYIDNMRAWYPYRSSMPQLREIKWFIIETACEFFGINRQDRDPHAFCIPFAIAWNRTEDRFEQIARLHIAYNVF